MVRQSQVVRMLCCAAVELKIPSAWAVFEVQHWNVVILVPHWPRHHYIAQIANFVSSSIGSSRFSKDGVSNIKEGFLFPRTQPIISSSFTGHLVMLQRSISSLGHHITPHRIGARWAHQQWRRHHSFFSKACYLNIPPPPIDSDLTNLQQRQDAASWSVEQFFRRQALERVDEATLATISKRAQLLIAPEKQVS